MPSTFQYLTTRSSRWRRLRSSASSIQTRSTNTCLTAESSTRSAASGSATSSPASWARPSPIGSEKWSRTETKSSLARRAWRSSWILTLLRPSTWARQYRVSSEQPLPPDLLLHYSLQGSGGLPTQSREQEAKDESRDRGGEGGGGREAIEDRAGHARIGQPQRQGPTGWGAGPEQQGRCRAHELDDRGRPRAPGRWGPGGAQRRRGLLEVWSRIAVAADSTAVECGRRSVTGRASSKWVSDAVRSRREPRHLIHRLKPDCNHRLDQQGSNSIDRDQGSVICAQVLSLTFMIWFLEIDGNYCLIAVNSILLIELF